MRYKLEINLKNEVLTLTLNSQQEADSEQNQRLGSEAAEVNWRRQLLHFRLPKSTGLSETPENRGGIASILESYRFTDRKVDGNKTPALMKMK